MTTDPLMASIRRLRLLPVALVGAVAALGLTGCVNSTDATEDEITRVVTEYVTLLEAGQAEAANALDTFDPTEAACPELFTDEVYATVADRPTNLEIISVDRTGDSRAWVEATVDLAGQSAVPIDLTLNNDGDTWLIQSVIGPGDFFLSATASPGEVSIQGACTTPLTETLLATVQVYPGTWTVSYADPRGFGLATEWTVSSTGIGQLGSEDLHVSVEMEPDPAMLARANQAMADLVEECVESLLDSPSCPEHLADLVTDYPGPVQSAAFISLPVVTVEKHGTSWRFTTDAPTLTWHDADGVERETGLYYRGYVVVENGTIVFTQGAPKA